MNLGPYMAYVFIYRFFILYTKKGVLGVKNFVVTSLQCFLVILAIKMA